MQKIRLRIQALFTKRKIDLEMDEEMRSHIELRTQANINRGMEPVEARSAASREFGWKESIKETCRDQRGVKWIEDLCRDIRFSLRQFRKTPGFTTVVVLTLALGIGANTAIFSVVNAVLLKPLPYHDSGRIVMLWADNPSLNLGFHELPPTPPDLLDWRKHAQSFEEIAGMRPRTADVSEQGDPERAGGAQVTANFFALFDVKPEQGRSFTEEEGQFGRDKVAIISHSLWQRHFGGSSNLIGKTITVNRERRTLVGIMPPGFGFPRGAEMPAIYGVAPQTDVWTPFADNAEYWRNDDTRDLIAMGRLKPGVAFSLAQAEMSVLARQEANENPKTHGGFIIQLRPLALQVTGKSRPALLVLLGAVAFVLLIACVNVASLLLCRSTSRRKEMAVRGAIGASRARLIRQLLTESAMLSIFGGALGLLLGALAVRVLLAISPTDIPRLGETALDGRVFAFTLLISLATGVVFGLAPAWYASKIHLTQILQTEGRSGFAGSRHRIHGLLVIAEVALAVMLLTGAGLTAKSFRRLQAVDPGFNPQRVAAFEISLFGDLYGSEQRSRQFFREARARLTALPGVHSTAAISSIPLGGAENLSYFSVEDSPFQAQGEQPFTERRKITPGYFETMGVSILRGRDFDESDDATHQKVCIINGTVARDFFPGVDPIGKRLKLGRAADKDPWLTIVGVAHDVRAYALAVKPKPQVYTSVEQDAQNEMTFVVRADESSTALLEKTVRAEMKSLDPALPLANFRALEHLMADATARPRFSAFLLGLFAATALSLTIVGLYGVVAYAASQRIREIGIRMALGATKENILKLIMRQGMAPPLAGLGLGIAGAFGLTRFLSSQLYEVKSTDPTTFLSVVLVLLLVVILACWLPARRASRIDPMEALRCE